MKLYRYPTPEQKEEICRRPALDTTQLFDTVQQVLNAVRNRGDEALLELTERFDGVKLGSLQVSNEEWTQCDSLLDEELKTAIVAAKENITRFHESQRLEEKRIETTPGVVCWQRAVAIEKVGLYIPGGTAPLYSTVLMLALPAKIAGCGEIVLCTPPDKQGRIHPAILFAARVAGVSRIYKVGGSQAIAAMAYGTQSIPKVYKIFGPGNQYVTAAKQLVSLKEVAIDMPAGPSEVMVVADASANPVYVAADFLSQAEHGADSQSVMLTTDPRLLDRTAEEVEEQTLRLSRENYIRQSLENSKLVLLKDNDELVELMNRYAPEHLIIQTSDYLDYIDHVINAGSVFLGAYTPESAGDYASGTNHTLPTNGHARAYSGVNLDSFVKKVTFQHISHEGLQSLGPVIEVMAQNEQLTAHKNAVTVRLKNNGE